MNKQIEELLNTLNGIASGDWIQMLPKEANLLLSYIKQLQQENEFLKLNNPEINIEHFRVVKENERKIKNLRYQNKQLQNNRDKAIDFTDITIELIKQQPTEDDTWILDRLKGFKNILKGDIE